jgi:LCP family protein required for cell wall assembly
LGLLLLILLVVLLAVTIWANGQIDRVPVPSMDGSGPGPDIVLIVGSDSRENLPDDLEGSFGDFAGSRADVIILAQVADGRARLLSLPRDLRVAIPGEGTNKINAAYAFGGPDLLVRTIQENLGIPIAHYAEVDFGGFASIVDAVGGVELEFEHPTRDQKSGLLVEEPGVQRVDGATALAYVRSRSTEELRDGEWRSGAGGDIERTGRQREVLSGIADSATSPRAIPRLPSLIVAVGDSVVVSEESQALSLGWFGWRFLTAGETDSIPLPVAGSTEGGVSYVVATEEAQPVITNFVEGEPIE